MLRSRPSRRWMPPCPPSSTATAVSPCEFTTPFLNSSSFVCAPLSRRLSLSTNCIEKIANLNGLKNLRILSLGRNNIKNLNGLEAVGDTLEELWISYNLIEKLKGIHVMKKLKVLYMSNNLVKEWAEYVKLADLPALVDLVFVGNPLEEKYSAEGNWIEEATKRLPKLKKLDGNPVIKQDEEDGEGDS
ncbi:dynein axonemal light chain 1 isoform X2 [Brienomyrus brachyistius]|uniref:dynein axonemal light chain 1 isoform X2 n=1 Tax=Brienomyrus brachyistius TaxID=42636 RepID=UPI0020B25508|nr:dynein axonemal light chain 1 isoform X2 [Brienomyrus brachyistius]XP_048830284.1 dynein axonemal light chain 1 isoform X2 [Brienomyrus brachyistius]